MTTAKDYRPCLGHAENFEVLKRAFIDGNVALMECWDTTINETVAVICAVNYDGHEYHFVPFAALHNGNPYARFAPSDPDNPGKFLPIELEG